MTNKSSNSRTKKSSTRSSTAKPKQKNVRSKSTWKRRFLIFNAKLAVTCLALFSFYLLYLDGKVRHSLDGQIWTLPAEVYSSIKAIRVADHPTLNEVKQILRSNNYRQTVEIAVPGDYKEQGNTITLIRRAFPFPQKAEPQRVLRLRFDNNQHLTAIEDLVQRRRVSSFKFAPKLITLIESNDEDRLITPLYRYPRLLIDTLLLTEDRNFYNHYGVSPISIARAMITNLRAGHTVQGGSTLTQQLVKNLFLSNQRSFTRKINEAFMSLLIDFHYDKNRILEAYLNEVYLGQQGNTQIHGFALASQFFFNRPIQEISLDQLALLVGMVKGPSLYNPWRYPKNALARRNVVLKILLKNQLINEELYTLLSARPLGVVKTGEIHRSQPAYMQLVHANLQEQLGEKSKNLSGMKIFTTLDLDKQQAAEKAVSSVVPLLRKQQKQSGIEGAMVIANYHNGGVVAIVGGANTQYAGFNRALYSQRQIGSLAKPSVYLTALSEPNRFQLNTKLNDGPIVIKVKGGADWRPKNYNRRYGQPVTLIYALSHSMNIPTVNLGMQVGLDKIIHTQELMGWDSTKIPRFPSMLLGSYSISPYDVTKLFQVIANRGSKIELSAVNAVLDNQGKVLYKRNQKSKIVVSPQAAYETLFAMQQVPISGTAKHLRNKYAQYHLAGKTGTTNDNRDSWYVGIDGDNVVTTWLGRDNNGKTGLTGASGALKVYQALLQNTPPTPLALGKMSGIEWLGVDTQGNWQCNSQDKIPVWNRDGVNYCNSGKRSSSNSDTPSIWDALNLSN